MKIISKLKDYYDGGSVYGIDEAVVLVRTISDEEKGKDISIKDLGILPSGTKGLEKKGDVEYNPFLIGFCGKIFVGYKIETVTRPASPHILNDEPTIKTKWIYNDEIIPEINKLLGKSWSTKRDEKVFT